MTIPSTFSAAGRPAGRPRPRAGHRAVALLTIAGLLGAPGAPLVVAQTATSPPRTTPAATTAATEPDGGWPRSYTTAGGAALAIYQPQVSSWTDQKRAVLYAAVAYTPKGAPTPSVGTIKVESDTSVALDQRLVSFSEFKITESNFPGVSREQLRTVVAEIEASVPLDERVIALDRVLANVDTSQIIPKNVDGVKADPPPIFFSTRPAVMVNIDGDPIWAPIPQNDLTTAVNTNWDLFEHGPTKTFYLRHDKTWLKAAAVKGPWSPAGTLPGSFAKLPDDDNWKEVKASLPGKTMSASQTPTVFVSVVPAELMLLRGEPSYTAVAGASQLLWVNNTESDVFRMGRSGPVYFLVAGRWFSAPDFTGPWTFATPQLPDDFKKIPLEHERSRVLAAVPGTAQAAEAILLAQIPQTARVSKTVQAPEVAYQGTPEFQPIENTTAQRAVNTDKDILKVGDLYYMCFQGVWFLSTTPTGPWTVSAEIPKTIYEIPVSSPSHSVTYVTVEDSDDDAVVFATAAAYTGVMVAWGCAVWGTGYYYPPYIGYGGYYPIYYPHYPTYGYGASYNPWTGAYTRGVGVYGPYGGAGAAARYNPRTGTYSRGAVAYGPYGSRGAASAYNPRTGAVGATRQGSNVYGSWGQTGVQRGDQWATTSRYTNNVTGNTTRRTETSGGGSATSRTGQNGRTTVGQSGSGDMYAGHDGNVYRKQSDSWQQYGDGGWSSANQPTPQQRDQGQNRTTSGGAQAGTRPAPSGWDTSTATQVNRDSAARAEGAQRTRDAGAARSGTSSSPGSYRPSGGGGASRGGGRRR